MAEPIVKKSEEEKAGLALLGAVLGSVKAASASSSSPSSSSSSSSSGPPPSSASSSSSSASMSSSSSSSSSWALRPDMDGNAASTAMRKASSLTFDSALHRFFPADTTPHHAPPTSPRAAAAASAACSSERSDGQGDGYSSDASTMGEYGMDGSVWTRLLLAADGKLHLNVRDAEIIMAAFQKTLEDGEALKLERTNETEYLSRRRQEIVQSMKTQLTTKLGDDDDNDDVLQYLTSHYLPMVPEEAEITASLDPVKEQLDAAEDERNAEKRSSPAADGKFDVSSKETHDWHEISAFFAQLAAAGEDKMFRALCDEYGTDVDGSMLQPGTPRNTARDSANSSKVDGGGSVGSGGSGGSGVSAVSGGSVRTMDKAGALLMVQALSRESSIGSKDVEKFVAGIFETNTHFTFDEFRVKLREAHEWTGLMRTVKHWDFDVFALRKLTKSPLKVVGIAAAREIQMFDRNDFDEERFEAFLVDVGKSYCKNPYHNALHAADVVQTCLHFLTDGGLMVATGISSLAAAGLLIAAAVHDVGHPGSNNHFLVATSAPLAIQYNDHSPLENMHLATAFSLMQKPANNFIERLTPFMKKELRRIIIAMVLATDNDRHFSMHERLEALVNSQRAAMAAGALAAGVEMDGAGGAGEARGGSLPRRMSGSISPYTLSLPSSSSSSSSSSGGGGGGGGVASRDASPADFPPPPPAQGSDNVGLGSGSADTHTGDGAMTMTLPPIPPGRRLSQAGGFNTPGRGAAITTTASTSNSNSNNNVSINTSVNGRGRKNSGTTASDSGPSPRNSQGSAGGTGTPMLGEKTQTSSSAPSDAQQMLLLESALHMADISNPAKPFEIYQLWHERVMEEFYHQGDMERGLDLPITNGFDRDNPIPPSKFQMGFIKVIVQPLYTTYSHLPGMTLGHCLATLESNIQHWKSEEEEAANAANAAR